MDLSFLSKPFSSGKQPASSEDAMLTKQKEQELEEALTWADRPLMARHVGY